MPRPEGNYGRAALSTKRPAHTESFRYNWPPGWQSGRVAEKHVGGQSCHWTYARVRQQPARLWPLSSLSFYFLVELLDPLLAVVRTKRVAHLVFDGCRVVEAKPSVRSAPLYSTGHGLVTGHD